MKVELSEEDIAIIHWALKLSVDVIGESEIEGEEALKLINGLATVSEKLETTLD